MAQARVELLADSSQVRRATDDLRDLERRGKTTTTVTNQLRNAFVALGGALAVRELARLSDTYTGIQNRLKIVTDSTAQLTEVQNKLLQVANDSRAEFETTVGLYSTLARSTEELGLSQERLLRVTETINKAFAASGADAATAAGAIRQLGQGLAAGALRGDEFNSVAEGAPEIMRAIAAETGMTIGALREFAAEGKITSELLITSLENYGDTVDDIFRNSERTIAQSFQEARNNAIQFIGGIEAVDDASQAFGDSIVALSENLDLVVGGVTALAALFGIRLAASIGESTQAFIVNTAATVKQTQSTAAAAAAEASFLRTVQASLVAQLQSSTVTAQQTALRQQLAANTVALTAAQRTANTAMTAGTVAARGLNAALSLVGGPIGLIVTAAAGLTFALATYSEGAETAAERSKRLAGELDSLKTSFADLTAQQLQSEYQAQAMRAFVTLPGDIAEAERKLAEATRILGEERAKLRRRGRGQAEYGDTEAAREAREAIERLEETIKRLNEEQDLSEAAVAELGDALAALGSQSENTATAVTQTSKAAADAKSNFDSLAASLTEQIIELRDGADAAEDFAIAQRLGADASEDEKKKIDDLVATLRELREERETERQRDKDKELGRTIGLSDEVMIQQQLNEQLLELERLKNEGLLSEAASYTERRNQLIADANERLAEMQEGFELVDWESFENRAAGAFAAVATGAMSGEDAVRGLAQSIATEAIGALIRLAIQSVIATTTASSAEQAAKATSAASTAAAMTAVTVATTAAASAATAAWAAPATLASIATLGGASATGLAALTAALAGGVTASLAAQATSAVANTGGLLAGIASFDGGGYTGNGPRTGGLDGKGGFAAIMHPRETVIDHTKAGGSGRAQIIINNNGSPMQVVSDTTTFTQGQETRIIQLAVKGVEGNINGRKEVHRAITKTTSANNRIGGS